MMPENDPLAEAAAALSTVVGSDEVALRARMGNDGYEAYQRRLEEIQTLEIDKQRSAAGLQAQQVKYLAAKTGFWGMLAGFVAAAMVLLAAVTIVWLAH